MLVLPEPDALVIPDPSKTGAVVKVSFEILAASFELLLAIAAPDAMLWTKLPPLTHVETLHELVPLPLSVSPVAVAVLSVHIGSSNIAALLRPADVCRTVRPRATSTNAALAGGDSSCGSVWCL